MMFCDKSPDLQPPDYESTERLLAEEEGHLWTGDEDDDTCITTATIFLQFIALAMVFLVGTLFGFFWRGDLDGLCGPYVSRYCKPSIKFIRRELSASLRSYSTFSRRSLSEISPRLVWWGISEGKYLSTGCKPRCWCSLGFSRGQL